jgi:hypothetical protein
LFRLRFPFLELSLDIAKHFFVFETDGQENGFQGQWMRHVDCGRGVEFGPVKKAVKRFLVFFAQTFAELFPPSPLRFQNMTERHNGSAHISSKELKGIDPILKIAEYSSFDEMSRKFLGPPFSLSTLPLPATENLIASCKIFPKGVDFYRELGFG